MLSKIDLFVVQKTIEIRKLKGISQLELANGIGVTAGFIGKVESINNSAKYNLQHLNKIALYLEISPQELLPKEAFNE